jgi:hypothetical protein
MPAGAHGAVPGDPPAAFAAGLGCLPATGGIVAGFAGPVFAGPVFAGPVLAGPVFADTVEVAAGVGLAHALP